MPAGARAALVAGAGAGGLLAGRALVQGRRGSDGVDRRWRVVTVYLAPDEVAPGGVLPGPLAELGDLVEVEVRPAPGGKGTELAARLREPASSGGLAGAAARLSGDDPRQDVRQALRRSKQLLEAGELLQVHPQPAGHRPSTPWGKAYDLVLSRAGREGVL